MPSNLRLSLPINIGGVREFRRKCRTLGLKWTVFLASPTQKERNLKKTWKTNVPHWVQKDNFSPCQGISSVMSNLEHGGDPPTAPPRSPRPVQGIV